MESAKQMMLLCVPPALEKSEEIKVTPPKELNNLRESAESLRNQANLAREKTQAGDGEGEEKKGGIMGAITGVVEKGNELFGKGVGAVLDAAAKSLDSAVNTVEEPMTKIGQDIVNAKKGEIKNVFDYVIGQLSLTEEGKPDLATELVRGQPPHGPEEYKAASGSVSRYLVQSSATKLAAQLGPVVQPEIDKHAAVKAWDKAIESYNLASAKLEENKLPAFAKIELNINEHIINQVIDQLAVLMGKEEAAIRENAVGKSQRCPQTFAAVFSGEKLTEVHFKNKDK